MDNCSIFDLMALLICSVKDRIHEDIDSVTEDSQNNTIAIINAYLNSTISEFDKKSHDKILLNSDTINDIVSWCKSKNDYFLTRCLICRLDSIINLDNVIRDFDFNIRDLRTSIDIENFETNSDNSGLFRALNSNCDETGIIILPLVRARGAYVTYDDGKEKERKNSSYWHDDINFRLKNSYFIIAEDIGDYKVYNAIISLPESRKEKSTIDIGFAPILNTELSKLFNIRKYTRRDDAGNIMSFFSVDDLYYKELINQRFKNCLGLATENDIDILVAPEMLGTDELTSTPFKNLNSIYESNNVNPFLILPPTYWNNNKNVLSVFTNSGVKIGEQQKQYRFDYHGYKEDLLEPRKEILIVHIDGWGRLAFPICKDFLQEEYSRILVVKLKASILIIPSFSFGVASFESSVLNGLSYGACNIWLNSCSALQDSKTAADYVGVASLPIISEQSPRTRIKRKCGGKCSKTCLFKVSIPINCVNGDLHDDQNISYEHIYKE